MADAIELLAEKLAADVEVHNSEIGKFKREIFIWQLLLLFTSTFSGLLPVVLGLLLENTKPVTDIWLCLIPIFAGIYTARDVSGKLDTEKRLLNEKLMLISQINTEQLKPEEIREAPDTFYTGISTTLQVINRNIDL